MTTEQRTLPLAAIVGQEPLKMALALNAVSPEIGGVLIRGERGNAKSTTVRAFSQVLPEIPVRTDCEYRCDPAEPASFCPSCDISRDSSVAWVRAPLVDLPLGATDDRVLGHLDLEHVLQSSHKRFVPGLLAAAHRGVLYIDEVNLLDDQLIDLLLDAAASGRVHVEREGFSLSYPSRFVLVGTMNPEEGEIRPQLLDRFGLSVEIRTPQGVDERVLIAERRLAFNRDPGAFARQWAAANREWQERITKAQTVLPGVVLTASVLRYIAEMAIAAQVEGVRADIVMAQASRAHAALSGRDCVTEEDVDAVKAMALDHRRRAHAPVPPNPGPSSQPRPPKSWQDQTGSQGSQGSGERPGSQSERSVQAADIPRVSSDLMHGQWPAKPAKSREREFNDKPRRLGQPVNPLGWGARRNIRVQDGQTSHVHWPSSLAGAASRAGQAPLRISAGDLSFRLARKRASVVFVFVLDTSASMAGIKRLGRVKGAVMQSARMIYRARARFAVMAFGHGRAAALLAPTKKIGRLGAVLSRLPAGGNTPLWDGLLETAQQLDRWRQQRPWFYQVVLVTDGKVAGLSDSVHTGQAAQQCRQALVRSPVILHVIDAESSRIPQPWAQRVAAALDASYRTLDGWIQEESS